MPPKADDKNKGKKKAESEFKDDAGEPIDVATFCQLLEKKIRAEMKAQQTPLPKDVLEQLHAVSESEDKQLVNTPIAQFMITANTPPESLPGTFKHLVLYQSVYYRSIVFKDILLDDEVFARFTDYLAKCPCVKNVEFINCNLSQNSLKTFFDRMQATKIQQFRIRNQHLEPNTLVTLGVQIEKFAQFALHSAQGEIDAARAKREEELQKYKENLEKNKKAKPPKPPKGIPVYDLRPVDLFANYYSLRQFSIELCDLRQHAGALTVLFDFAAPYIETISLMGNQLTSEHIGAIGKGLDQAAARLGKPADKYPIAAESYMGTQAIKLQKLNLGVNNIGEGSEEFYKQFCCAVLNCGCLTSIDLSANPIQPYLKLLAPAFSAQVKLIQTPINVQNATFTEVLKINENFIMHVKKQTEVAKQIKKLDKEAKKNKKAVTAPARVVAPEQPKVEKPVEPESALQPENPTIEPETAPITTEPAAETVVAAE